MPAAADVEAFEADALEAAGVALDAVPPRYRSTYFSHIWSSGYSAGYYSYIWSEVLDADSVEWFKENGGLLRENGDHFRRTLLSKGGSVDAMTLFRDFRGADPDVRPTAGAPRAELRGRRASSVQYVVRASRCATSTSRTSARTCGQVSATYVRQFAT